MKNEDLELLEGMRRINSIRESMGIPLFKTIEEYIKWRESEVEYDN